MEGGRARGENKAGQIHRGEKTTGGRRKRACRHPIAAEESSETQTGRERERDERQLHMRGSIED